MRVLGLLLIIIAASWMRPADVRAADPPAAAKSTGATSKEAESENLSYSPQWPEPPNTGAMLLRLTLGTVFVLVLCVGSLYLGKPWLMKLQGNVAINQAMQIEGSVTLGNRAVLYLVKIGDTQMVAGTDATGLKSLIALPASFKEVLDEQVPTEEPVATAPPQDFELRVRAAAAS